MKILYAGYVQGINNPKGNFFYAQRLVNGLTRLGHSVAIFNDRDTARYSNFLRSSSMGAKSMNSDFVKYCIEYRPDMIILGHCEKISNDSILEVRKLLKGVKIIYTNVDPLTPDNSTAKFVKRRSEVVDGVFITTAGDHLKQLSGNKAFISFWPNMVDSSIDTGQADQKNNDVDLFFAASSLGQHDRRAIFLNDLINELSADVEFNLLGAGINNKRIESAAYMDCLANSSMGLILNKSENYYLYASDRMSHYMANGMLCFCDERPQYTDIFNENEIVTYKSAKDLAVKINDYKENPDLRRAMAKKGREKIHKIFQCDLVAQYLIDMVYEDNIERDYAWPTEKY